MTQQTTRTLRMAATALSVAGAGIALAVAPPAAATTNDQALPLLRQEVLKAQSARIDEVSGAAQALADAIRTHGRS